MVYFLIVPFRLLQKSHQWPDVVWCYAYNMKSFNSYSYDSKIITVIDFPLRRSLLYSYWRSTGWLHYCCWVSPSIDFPCVNSLSFYSACSSDYVITIFIHQRMRFLWFHIDIERSICKWLKKQKDKVKIKKCIHFRLKCKNSRKKNRISFLWCDWI